MEKILDFCKNHLEINKFLIADAKENNRDYSLVDVLEGRKVLVKIKSNVIEIFELGGDELIYKKSLYEII